MISGNVAATLCPRDCLLPRLMAIVLRNFCSLTGQLFTALQDAPRVRCFPLPASAPWRLLILFGSLALLLATFWFQVLGQSRLRCQ
jgi:hypothetical protein